MELFDRGTPVLICAPMVRYSKLAFRLLVKLYGCDLTFTPMILADSFYNSEQARFGEFTTHPADNPTIVQFAANQAHHFAGCAELVANHARGIDLNCGCPQRWAVKEGIGACLIDKPEFIADVVRQTRARISDTSFSVSVKIRVHSDIKKTVDLCRKVEAAGVSFLSVHGRTIKQKSTEAEPVDLEAIKTIRQSVQLPIVANGDVFSLEGAQHTAEVTGAAGIMAARGLLENPAMYAGHSTTPASCVQDWVRLALSTGTHFTCFHHHLIYMLSSSLGKAERKAFNALTSTAAVLDYMQNQWDLQISPSPNCVPGL